MLEFLASSLPLTGSDVAKDWDNLYAFMMWVSVFFFVLVIGGMIYFAYRFRYREGTKSSQIEGNEKLEIIWTVIPTILVLVFFAWGWVVYRDMVRTPANAYEVQVIGKQWLWQFQYSDGRSTTNELFVPANRPVKLVMTSTDVIHSFFIPSFRVKQDVVPSLYTTVWFEANTPGKHQVYCAEYCGTAHSGMLATLYALDEKHWDLWQRGRKIRVTEDGKFVVGDAVADAGAGGGGGTVKSTSLADQGKKVVETKGCMACHNAEGKPGIGPSWKGTFGSQETLVDGSEVTVDENYIRESIMKPQAKLVKGFNPVMPTYEGQINADEMNAIIAYIRSLK